MYSHILQFKAIRLPTLRNMVLKYSPGIKCTKKDCVSFLDAKVFRGHTCESS